MLSRCTWSDTVRDASAKTRTLSIQESLDEPEPPVVCVGRSGKWIATLERRSMLTIAETRRASITSGGKRINTTNHSLSITSPPTELTIVNVLSGKEWRISGFGDYLSLRPIGFSPDERYFALVVERHDICEISWVDCESRKVFGRNGLRINVTSNSC